MTNKRNQTDCAVLNTAFSIMLDGLGISGEKYDDGYVLYVDGDLLKGDENEVPLFHNASEIVACLGDRLLGLQVLDEIALDGLKVDDFVNLANGVDIKDYTERWEDPENAEKASFNSFLPFTASEWRDILVKMVEETNYEVTDMDNPYHKLLNVLLSSDVYNDGAALGGLLITSEVLADQSGIDLGVVLGA